MPATITQLVFNGTADGPVAMGVDVVEAARRVMRAGLTPTPRGRQAPRQRLVGVDGTPVRTAAGRPLVLDGMLSLRSLGAGDVLVLPGLGMATPQEITAALQRPDVLRGVELVARAAAKGVHVAASCSATFVLAAAGILDGGDATTTWWLGPLFARCFPNVTLRPDRMVVASRGVLTAGSAFAHVDLMLAILARTVGPTVAHTVSRYLVVDQRPSQARYMVMEHLGRSNPVVRKLEQFIHANLHRRLTLRELARATSTSPRTLARNVAAALAITPQRFVQRLRVAQAVHLLETTKRPAEEVALDVGYADAAAFRRIFRRETGETPGGWRARVMDVSRLS